MKDNINELTAWLSLQRQKDNFRFLVIGAICLVAVVAALCAAVYFIRGREYDDEFYDFDDDFEDDEFDEEEDLFVD